MRLALSILSGAIAGAVLAAVSLYALVLPVMRSTRNDDGLLRLERGASAWRRVSGGPKGPCHRLSSFGDGVVMAANGPAMEWTLATGQWTPSTRLAAEPAVPGSGGRWFMLEDGKAFSFAEGACQLFAEPERQALPPFSTCPAAAVAATRLDDSSTLVLLVDDSLKKYRAWQLPVGAATWKDLGPLDVPLAAGELVPGPKAQALFVSPLGALLALDEGKWKTLPTEPTPRSGERAAFLADGSVVACGGSRELGAQRPLLNFGLPLGVLAACIVAAWYARARPLPLLLAALAGATATGVVALVLLLTSTWH
jgi:hypothetical protein